MVTTVLTVTVLSVIMLSFPMTSSAHFNLYISQQQVKTLMGLSAELYYVRDGIVNEYAMSFIVPVPSHLTYIEFTWQALTRHPLHYEWRVEENQSDLMGMLPPHLNISERGLVPRILQVFRVNFPCTGAKSAEVLVLLSLEVSSAGRPSTHLVFKRNKICLKAPPSTPASTTTVAPTVTNGSAVRQVAEGATAGVYLAGGGAAAALLLLTLAAAAAAYFTRTKTSSRGSINTSYSYGTTGAYLGNPNVFLRLDSGDEGSYATIDSCRKVDVSPYAMTYVTSTDGTSVQHHIYSKPHSVVSYSTSNVSERTRVLEVGREATENGLLVQEGTYGQVFLSTNILGPKVLVKTVSEKSSQLQATMLLCEGTRLSAIVHDHVLSVIAASAEPMDRPILVYPAPANGNLKLLLSRKRKGGEGPGTQDLVSMAIQVATACMYLHTHAILHKDIAARNCFLDDWCVRVGDSALSRDLFPKDYESLPGETDTRPIRWLPPETIVTNRYHETSDLWMYGVLLWELMTLAEDPYQGVLVSDLYQHLLIGNRLQQPITCPDQLYGVMKCCWVSEPNERPTFAQILPCLIDFATSLRPYI